MQSLLFCERVVKQVRRETVVPIQPKGSIVPLFLIGPGMEAASFVRYLGDDQPIYGIRLPALTGSCVPPMEEVARLVAREIRRVRPNGPYALAGWCAAGLIGLEVARQIESLNGRVAFAALFDARTVLLPSMGRVRERWVRGWMYCQKILFFLHKVAKRGLHPIRIAWKGRTDRLSRASRQIRGIEAPDLIGQSLGRYRPAPWNGRVVHIWAQERPRGRYRDPEFAWSEVSPNGFKFYEVPGDHLTMLQEPAVARVALILARELRAASVQAKHAQIG